MIVGMRFCGLVYPNNSNPMFAMWNKVCDPACVLIVQTGCVMVVMGWGNGCAMVMPWGILLK